MFADIAESGVFPCLTLTTNYRQRGSSSIIAASQQIKKGENVLAQDDYFRMKRVDGDRAINAYLADIIPRRFNREHPFGLQVIVPLNRYRSGVNGINRVLQNVLNAGGKEIKSGMMSFREGDKVFFSNTRYSRHHEPIYVNGQTGIITDVSQNPMKITVRTQNGQVSLGYSEIINGNLSLAYAMTIHKSQGSQFDEVFVVLPEASKNFVTRNMLYTAVTRAVKSLTVVYSGKGPSKVIANNSTRLTFLRDKLINLWAKLK